MPEILDRRDVVSWMQDGAQLVDVLPPEEYEQVHLAGAINLPLKTLDEAPEVLDRTFPVVVYCSGAL